MKLEDLGKGISLEMVLIPAGTFMMGSPASEKGRDKDETQHEVTLTKPYYMGKYAVTQGQWGAVMKRHSLLEAWLSRFLWSGMYPITNKYPNYPVTNVSWEDCQEFIKKLNAKTDGGYRLPTEAEWEYACRAGTTTAFFFGDKITREDANYNWRMEGLSDVAQGAQKEEVGRYEPNAFGLYDMHGNVSEWCEDWYEHFSRDAVTDPKGPARGEYHVLRGGSFYSWELGTRCSARGRWTPSDREGIWTCGFRLARTAGFETEDLLNVTKPDQVAVISVVGDLLVAPFGEAKATEIQKAAAMILQKEVEQSEDLGKGIKLDMVLIPAGKFMMGSLESGKYWADKTQHEVTLTKPFYIGKYQVTQEQWEAVMGNNPSNTKGAKIPVTDVCWEDCQEFIKKLNDKTDGGYMLPSEPEWEYACRAGTTTAYSFGDKITPQDANYDDSNIAKPIAVGSYKPNAFGLYDMHGNVWELCQDVGRFDIWPSSFRGGSSSFSRKLVPESGRNEAIYYRDSYSGFRLARTP